MHGQSYRLSATPRKAVGKGEAYKRTHHLHLSSALDVMKTFIAGFVIIHGGASSFCPVEGAVLRYDSYPETSIWTGGVVAMKKQNY